MKLHSDTLTIGDLRAALPRGVVLEAIERGSRSRKHGFEFRLTRPCGTRWTNSGKSGAGDERAASWDDHGIWMADLFDRDPDAIIGPYKGRGDFYRATTAYAPRGASAPWLATAKP